MPIRLSVCLSVCLRLCVASLELINCQLQFVRKTATCNNVSVITSAKEVIIYTLFVCLLARLRKTWQLIQQAGDFVT